MKPMRPTRAGGVLPDIHLDHDVAVPLYEQLYSALSESIVIGSLNAGARLASTRAFADALGVSRFTLLSAFEQLRSEGYIESRPGGGTYVTKTLPELSIRARRARTVENNLVHRQVASLSESSASSGGGSSASGRSPRPGS